MNTCNYSDGNKHECCTHPTYCIFNENRDRLERQITKLQREYYDLKRLHDNYFKGCYCGDLDFNFLLRKLDLVKHNISRMVKFRKMILDGDVNGYGFMDVEGL